MSFKHLKDCLNLKRIQLLVSRGINNGAIVPFDDEVYEPLKNHYFNGLPIYLLIKYTRPELTGECYTRASYMFPCYENALYVVGDHIDLGIFYGKEDAGHAWIEQDGYVYDPSDLAVYKIEDYYRIYKVTNVVKYNWAKFMLDSEASKQLYFDIKNTKIEDYLKPGPLRYKLPVVIPLIQGIAQESNNLEFINELYEHIDKINYNYDVIMNEMNKELGKVHISNIRD